MMLTCSKNFSVGVVSVAAPAASQPLSVSQRQPIFLSLIVPAVNAEKMAAVGCCKATSFSEFVRLMEGKGTETPGILLKYLLLSLLRWPQIWFQLSLKLGSPSAQTSLWTSCLSPPS